MAARLQRKHQRHNPRLAPQRHRPQHRTRQTRHHRRPPQHHAPTHPQMEQRTNPIHCPQLQPPIELAGHPAQTGSARMIPGGCCVNGGSVEGAPPARKRRWPGQWRLQRPYPAQSNRLTLLGAPAEAAIRTASVVWQRTRVLIAVERLAPTAGFWVVAVCLAALTLLKLLVSVVAA